MNRERTLQEKTQFTFKLTYYLLFKAVRKLLRDLHVLLTVDQAHQRGFSEVPIMSFKNAKSFKYHLVRAALFQLDRE